MIKSNIPTLLDWNSFHFVGWIKEEFESASALLGGYEVDTRNVRIDTGWSGKDADWDSHGYSSWETVQEMQIEYIVHGNKLNWQSEVKKQRTKKSTTLPPLAQYWSRYFRNVNMYLSEVQWTQKITLRTVEHCVVWVLIKSVPPWHVIWLT